MNKEKGRDNLGLRLRRITADLKLYIEKRMELLAINAGEYFSSWMAASVQRATGLLLLIGGLGFILFALAIYLGNLLGSESLGYVLVSVPLLIAGFMFLYLKPAALNRKLQQMFETEVVNALNKNEELKRKEAEMKETLRSTIEKEQ